MSNWSGAFAWGDHATAGYLKSETDPAFNASVAAGISSADTSNWSNAFAWGDHAGAGYLQSEADPVFNASVARSINSSNVSNWNTAHSWGNHAGAGYLTSEIDPQVGDNAASRVPRWDGTALVSGSIYDDGSKVGIGTSSPAGPFQIGGSAARVDQSVTTLTSGWTFTSVMWQSFTVGDSGSLSRVEFKTNSCNTASGTLTIYRGQGMGGAVLASQPYSITNVCNDWAGADLLNPISASAGELLTFSFTTSSTIFILMNNTEAYPNGTFYSNAYGSAAGYDILFRTYMAPPVPLAVASDGNVGIGTVAPARSLHVNDVLRLEPRTTEPDSPEAGDLYFDGSLGRLRYYSGSGWVSL
jgi:hypothetical protein